MELSLVTALALLILFFHALPKRFSSTPPPIPPVVFRFTLEEIPMTRWEPRGARRPQRPAVPIASEEPDLPQDAVLEASETTSAGGGLGPLTAPAPTAQDTIPPRPLVQVLPEYPKELQRLNVRGVVRLMLWVNDRGIVEQAVVKENTTGSDACEAAALSAAQKSVFQPGMIDRRPTAMWFTCSYSFKPN